MKTMIAVIMLVFVAGAAKIAHQPDETHANHKHITHSTHDLCEGFVPENDMKIPVDTFFAEGGGITEEEFNAVIDRAYEVYGPIIAEQGKVLDIERLWTNSTVNANAQQTCRTERICEEDEPVETNPALADKEADPAPPQKEKQCKVNRICDVMKVRMYGGLARHPSVNVEAFATVVCHEIGHHLGGAPKTGGWNPWAANEGQSDYFATAKCMRKFYTAEENEQYNKGVEISELAYTNCVSMFSGDRQKMINCFRSASGGESLATLLRDLGESGRANKKTQFALPIVLRLSSPGPIIPIPEFGTPDPNIVKRTYNRHPAAQCRLDTYFQGALCSLSHELTPDNKDSTVGMCNRSDFTQGVRPLCWYKPPATEI